MVTINAVEVTPDYAHAKVFFSLLTGDPEQTQEALNQAAGFLRNGLFKRLHIHTVPTLHFIFDRTTERAADMNALIAKAVASRQRRRGATGGTAHDRHPSHARVQRRPCMGCCCSTNRWACPATRPCKRPNGCCAPKKPATPARSIRWPPACCRCALARPPSSASLQLDADKTYEAIAAPGRDHHHGRCRRRGDARAPVRARHHAEQLGSQVRQRFTGPHHADCRRCTAP
jgi:ribosome-binding factor A